MSLGIDDNKLLNSPENKADYPEDLNSDENGANSSLIDDKYFNDEQDDQVLKPEIVDSPTNSDKIIFRKSFDKVEENGAAG